MSDLAQLCVDTVQQAGGRMAYRDLLAAIPAENRPRLATALKEARALKALDQEVAMVNGKVVQTLFTL